MATKEKNIVIVGPTASGKTALAIELAQKFNGEIICADSRTIYRLMDIGTAKPTSAEQVLIKHHLIDIKEPNEQYSVVEFKTECLKALKSIHSRGKLPFIVGGSGMYIDSVLYDYRFRPNRPSIVVAGMSYEQKIASAKELYPISLAEIDVKNERRLDQLLQFGPATTSDRKNIKIGCEILGVGINKLIVKQNITYRTKIMLNKGLVQETENIINKFGRNCAGLNTIGYKQCVDYIDCKLSKSELEDAINKATLSLAKRQLTWFKRNHHINWLESANLAGNLVKNYLARF